MNTLKQVLKFGIAGIFNTGVDWVFYFMLSNWLQVEPTVSKGIGVAAGMTSAFILNMLFVFGQGFTQPLFSSTQTLPKAKLILSLYFKMLAAYSVGMTVNIIAFWICIAIEVPEFGALLVATTCSFGINFILSQRYVFNK
ncbi:MAG: GtrA family protein [Rufibacter sp.]